MPFALNGTEDPLVPRQGMSELPALPKVWDA
jgi:hypothetical protein